MMRIRSIILTSSVVLGLIFCSGLAYGSSGGEGKRHYRPDWKDLDSRPLPQWYDQAKVGIFIHWGVFSVPSFVSEWFWYYWKTKSRKPHNEVVEFMRKNYAPGFSYQDFAADFKAEFFNASKWANLFKASGAKYVVLTSKHHEGFTLWPSKHSFSWNAVDTGPRRDLVGELSKAIKTTDLKFGLYYSLFEWFNPLFLEDEKKAYRSQTYPPAKTWPDLKHIVEEYQPSVVWSDGDWGAPGTYWNATELIAWMYNESPTKDEIVVNDRWGSDLYCKHGDFYTCADRYSPGVVQKHKWENCFTIDKKSWGFRRNAHLEDYMTIQEILKDLVTTVSCGGNVLINVGPTKEGIITPIYEERLLDLGGWLSINGEAIYDTSPWIKQNDTANGVNVWYTCKRNNFDGSNPTALPASGSDVNAVFLMTLQWPDEEVLTVKDIAPFMKHGSGSESTVTLLDGNLLLKWQLSEDGSLVKITFPSFSQVVNKNAWAVKIVF